MSSSSTKDRVLIFQTNLLRYSETFIPAQAEKFESFVPYYAGFRRVPGINPPGDRTYPATSSEWISWFREVSSVLGWIDPAYVHAIREIGPRLIHAHFEYGGIRTLPLAKALKIPLVVTCHGIDVTEDDYQWQERPFLGPYFLGRRKKLLESGMLFVGVSKFICEQMLKRGYPADKVRLHYIGVDCAKFRPDPTVEKKPMLLFVGRLVEKKGGEYLMQAMKEVSAKHPEVNLSVVGDGPLKPELERIARAEKLNVSFLGVQPQETVLQLLRESLALCSPSVRAGNGDSEGLGIVNLEAQAVGVPVIGTLHGGIPEAVENGVTGLLSRERDVSELAANILALLDDAPLRERMGAAARERIVQQFDLVQCSRALEQLYLKIL